MKEHTIFKITVNSMNHEEWQGWVDFPDSGERYSFQSLLELIKMVTCKTLSDSTACKKDKNNF